MSKFLMLPFPSVTLTGVGVGIATSVAFSRFGRPLVVGALKLGYEAKDGTVRLFDDARQMASDVRDEARGNATEATAEEQPGQKGKKKS